MVKAYLRYEPVEALGVITSASTLVYGTDGSTVITAALEHINIWNVRSGELVISSLLSRRYQFGNPSTRSKVHINDPDTPLPAPQ